MNVTEMCGTCRNWQRLKPDPAELGVCEVLSRPAGAVSTYIERENGAAFRFKCSRWFGCHYWIERSATE